MSEARATNICCEQPRCPGFLCACIGKQYDALVARNKKLTKALLGLVNQFKDSEPCFCSLYSIGGMGHTIRCKVARNALAEE